MLSKTCTLDLMCLAIIWWKTTKRKIPSTRKQVLHDLQIWDSLNWWRGFSSITIPAKRKMPASQFKHILIVPTTTKKKMMWRKNKDKLVVTYCFHIYWVHLFQSLQMICFIRIKHTTNETIDLCKIWHHCMWQVKFNKLIQYWWTITA